MSEAGDFRASPELAEARRLLAGGRHRDAADLLRGVTEREPDLADGWWLLGGAMEALGDLAGAEAALRRAVLLDAANARSSAALAALLRRAGRLGEAEAEFRRALAIDPAQPVLAAMTARLLNGQGRHHGALALTSLHAVDPARAETSLLWEHAEALAGAGRLEEALAARQALAARAPADPIAAHNLGAALHALKLYDEAEAALRRAIALGSEQAETWWLLSGVSLNLGRFEACEAQLRETIARAPMHLEAWRELGHLVWMRTGDLATAAGLYDLPIARRPDVEAFRVLKARIHQYAGDAEGAYRLLTQPGVPGDSADIEVAAAQAAMRFDRVRALAHARRAMRLQPESHVVRSALLDLLVANGESGEALSLADALLAEDAADQHALALKATALRQRNDPDLGRLIDYSTMVRGWTIDTPDGWPNLPAYLSDLKAALLRLHTLKAHPIGQSLRNGDQTHEDLTASDDPAIRAFFEAIDGPIRRHMVALGEGADPLRRRNTFEYRISGVWSVRLKPGGFHEDHFHPQGWLSSACYVDLPPAVEEGGREGWIKFGEPGVTSDPLLAAEHHVKPEPGLLVLFPSYMWHGTVPFGGDRPRLTIAFDVVPA